MSYETHNKFYDITDRAARIQSKMHMLASLIEPGNVMPNSLQSVLGKIYRYEGSTQREISKIYQIDYKNVIRYISDLESRDLVYKKQLDTKRKGIYLTEEGRRIIEAMMAARGDMVETVLENVSEEDLLVTSRTLDRLIEEVAAKVRRLEEEKVDDY